MQAFTTSVAIIGAGPAGLATATRLAQQGIDFLIIDQLPEAQNTSRAAVIHAATLTALSVLGLTEPLLRQGIRVPHFRVRDRDTILLPVSFSGLRSSTPFALMIPQDETEAIMLRRLEELGHNVMRPLVLEAVQRRQTGATLSCHGPMGSVEISCRYVVGADGEHSTVRHEAGIDFPGDTYGSFLLADVKMAWPLPRDEVTLFFSGEGTLVVAPMSGERFRVVAQKPGAPAQPTIADVQAVIDGRGPGNGSMVQELLWGSRFQVHHKLADRFFDDPIVLLGDAAHVHSPAGGQGMNLGLRDAVALSHALGEAVRSGSERALIDYSHSRRSAARRMLSITDRLTKVATARSPLVRWLRNRLIQALSTMPLMRKRAALLLAGLDQE
jgi:2-polyprenyl-6-methoxyphenol hydroxylase-like FAD-dependent oxidoreductase